MTPTITKPVAIFRHVAHEGPGALGEFLDRTGIPWLLIAIDREDLLPASPTPYSGLVFMGGPMSVNDTLPWIPHALELIRLAAQADIPVLGHCLGGQLMAKALGGRVTANPVKEIGWGEARVTDTPESAAWFAETRAFPAFHWHGETFSIPDGATRILESSHCQNQGYVHGKHLALQCHVEVTAAMIDEWCQVGAEEIATANSPAAHTPERIRSETPTHLPVMQAVAERLYGRWIKGLSSS